MFSASPAAQRTHALASPLGGGGSRRPPARRLTEGAAPANPYRRLFLRSADHWSAAHRSCLTRQPRANPHRVRLRPVLPPANPHPRSCLPLRGRWQPPISREAADGRVLPGDSAPSLSWLRGAQRSRRIFSFPLAPGPPLRASVYLRRRRTPSAARHALASPLGGGGSRRSPARRLTEGAAPANLYQRLFLRSADHWSEAHRSCLTHQPRANPHRVRLRPVLPPAGEAVAKRLMREKPPSRKKAAPMRSPLKLSTKCRQLAFWHGLNVKGELPSPLHNPPMRVYALPHKFVYSPSGAHAGAAPCFWFFLVSAVLFVLCLIGYPHRRT